MHGKRTQVGMIANAMAELTRSNPESTFPARCPSAVP